jgi:endonuclease G
VAPDVLVTNRHVSEMLKSSSGALECVVRFRVEADEYLREQVVKVSKLICDSTRTDVAALQLSEEVKSPPLPMERGRVDPGAQVTVVGHPFPDNERNPNFISLVFGNEFYLKRASPGEVIPMRGKADASFDHDCSTLGGNSGSPIVSMASGKVVGLHREGSFLERNSGIGAASLLRFLAKCKV